MNVPGSAMPIRQVQGRPLDIQGCGCIHRSQPVEGLPVLYLGLSVGRKQGSHLWSLISMCADWHQYIIHVCGFTMDSLTYPEAPDLQNERRKTRQ